MAELTVHLGDAGKVEFDSIADILAWIMRERKVWGSFAPFVQGSCKHETNELQHLASQINANEVLAKMPQAAREKLADQITAAFTRIPPTTSSRMQFIMLAYGDDPARAAGRFVGLNKKQASRNDAPLPGTFYRGLIDAAIYENDTGADFRKLLDEARSFSTRIMELLDTQLKESEEVRTKIKAVLGEGDRVVAALVKNDATWQTRLEAIVAQSDTELKRAGERWELRSASMLERDEQIRQSFMVESKGALDQFAATVKESVGSMTDRIQYAVNEHDNRLKAMENTLKAELSLKAPAEYWTKKAEKHRDSAWLYKWWLIGASVIGPGLIVVFIILSLGRFGNTAPTWIIGSLIAFSAFVFWGVRIIAKLYMSHVHLALDADERHILITTYEAMLLGGTAKPEQADAMYRTIFRPSADGLVAARFGPDMPWQEALRGGR